MAEPDQPGGELRLEQRPGYTQLREAAGRHALIRLERNGLQYPDYETDPVRLHYVLEDGRMHLCDHLADGPAEPGEEPLLYTGNKATYLVQLDFESDKEGRVGIRVNDIAVTPHCKMDELAELIRYCREQVERYGEHPDRRIDSLTLPQPDRLEDEFERTRFLTAWEFDVPPSIVKPIQKGEAIPFKEGEVIPFEEVPGKEWVSDGRPTFEGLSAVWEGPTYGIQVREVSMSGNEGVVSVVPEEIKIRAGRNPSSIKADIEERFPMIKLRGNPKAGVVVRRTT